MEVKENITKNEEIEDKEFKPLDETSNNKKEKSDVLIVFGILCTIFILLALIIFCTFSLINISNTK